MLPYFFLNLALKVVTRVVMHRSTSKSQLIDRKRKNSQMYSKLSNGGIGSVVPNGPDNLRKD